MLAHQVYKFRLRAAPCLQKSQGKIMNDDKVWMIYPGVRLESWDGQKQQTIAMPDATNDNKALLKQYNEHMAVAWQLLMKGDAIPQSQETQ